MKKRLRRKLGKAEFAPRKTPVTLRLMAGGEVISSAAGTLLEYPKRKPKHKNDRMPMSWSGSGSFSA